MFEAFRDHFPSVPGTMHLPLTYHIMEYHWLIYKLRVNMEAGDFDYRFTPFRPSKYPYEVPCMSTCGMMMSREVYNYVGGWPKELGIYSGGEHFLNFTLATLGYKKYIYPAPPLHHHGDNRNYHFTYDDQKRNRFIATYMFGGKEMAIRIAKHTKAKHGFATWEPVLEDIFQKCGPQREMIKTKQIISIEDWYKSWCK